MDNCVADFKYMKGRRLWIH